LEAALELLTRTEVVTVPLGGGTVVNQPNPNPVEVVDLQALGLSTIEVKGKKLEMGATLTLQQLVEAEEVAPALKRAIRHEATYNLRQVATVAGTLVSIDSRSPFATAMLALGTEITLQPGDQTVDLGEFLPLRAKWRRGHLITKIASYNNLRLAYDYVARTPADSPVVCVAVAQWPSERTRVALGGFGNAPLLAMDGPEAEGADAAARDAYHEAGDQWASAEYRREVAATLVNRCLQSLTST